MKSAWEVCERVTPITTVGELVNHAMFDSGTDEHRWRRRPKPWFVIGLAAALMLCLLLIGLWRLWPGRLRPVQIQQVRTMVEHSEPLTVAALSPDGRFLAISDFKHNRRVPTDVMVFSLQEPHSQSFVVRGPETQCHALSFHPTKTLLAIGGENGVVRIADVQKRAIVQEIEIHGNRSPPPGPQIDLRRVRAMAFSPDGSVLAIGTEQREIDIWSTTNWRRQHTLPRHSDEINDLAFSADGKRMLSAGGRWESIPNTAGMRRRPEIFQWTTNNWRKISEIEWPDSTRFAKHVIYVSAVLAAVGNHGGELAIINTSSGKVVGHLVGHENMIGDLAYDRPRNLLISTSPEQTVIWDLESWSKAATMQGSTFVAYHPPSGFIATAFTQAETTCVLSRIVIDEHE